MTATIMDIIDKISALPDPLVKMAYDDPATRQELISLKYPAIASVIYVVVIFTLKAIFQKRPLEVRWAVAFHNLFLCVLSFIMALYAAIEGLRLYVQTQSVYEIYCNDTGLLQGRVWFWALVFYLSKYYELFDTVLLAIRGRSLQFLHVYHHIIIMPLCLVFIREGVTYFWLGVVFNGTVHTFMYYYYFMDSMGYRLWWKSHLTKGQIFQFCYGIFSCIPWPYICNEPYLKITGSMLVFWFNQAVLLSFLFLFSRFYLRTYSTSQTGKKTPVKTSSGESSNKAKTNGKDAVRSSGGDKKTN